MEDRAPDRFAIPAGRNGCPTSDQVRRDAQPAMALPAESEAAIVATLTRPLAPDETYSSSGENRERALREIFDRLSAAQALTLSRRLVLDRDTDGVSLALRRLTVARRQRLLAYLADTRRRLALSRSRIVAE